MSFSLTFRELFCLNLTTESSTCVQGSAETETEAQYAVYPPNLVHDLGTQVHS